MLETQLEYQMSLAQVAKSLMVDTRDSSSKPSYFTFQAKFISKINEADSILPFSQKKETQLESFEHFPTELLWMESNF